MKIIYLQNFILRQLFRFSKDLFSSFYSFQFFIWSNWDIVHGESVDVETRPNSLAKHVREIEWVILDFGLHIPHILHNSRPCLWRIIFWILFVISFSKIYHIIGVTGEPFICLWLCICLCVCLCISIFVRIWIADIISVYGLRGTWGLTAVFQLIYELRNNCCGRVEKSKVLQKVLAELKRVMYQDQIRSGWKPGTHLGKQNGCPFTNPKFLVLFWTWSISSLKTLAELQF